MGSKQKRTIIRKRIGHALSRLKERHGLFLHESEYFEAVDDIICGRSEFLIKTSNTSTIHRVLIRNVWVPCVYSKKQKVIITVYQNKWIKKGKRGYYIKKQKEKVKKPKKDRAHWSFRKSKRRIVKDAT